MKHWEVHLQIRLPVPHATGSCECHLRPKCVPRSINQLAQNIILLCPVGMARLEFLKRKQVSDYYILNVSGGDGQEKVQSRGLRRIRRSYLQLAELLTVRERERVP
jgi:hypothetical protein